MLVSELICLKSNKSKECQDRHIFRPAGKDKLTPEMEKMITSEKLELKSRGECSKCNEIILKIKRNID